MISAILSSFLIAQAMPITKVGTTCPLGYYVSSGYCMPSSGNKSQWALPKEGSSCPLGSYPSGRYCVKSYGR